MRVKHTERVEVEKKAKQIEDSLSAYDFKPDHYVRVVTDEGCDFTFASAFVLRYYQHYIVFAEHHDPMVFHKEDVTSIYQFKIVSHGEKDFQDAHYFEPVKKKK